MTYEAWEADVPLEIRDDPVWRVEAYRLGLFLSDLAWADATNLMQDRRHWSTADQLARAASNISSSVCEGFSRSTSKDRARFYEYSLGSARESRDWYYKGRRGLKPDVVQHRYDLASQLVRLLTTMISNERRANRRIAKRMSDE